MKKELELYVHIPFCIKKCAYCDFLSGPADEKTIESYVKALCSEIKNQGALYQAYHVTTIFLGGGTPSVLSGKQMEQIFDCLKESFCICADAEVSMEANPGTVTEEKLTAYKKIGINRISFGLQSTDQEELKILGRIHTYEEFLVSYKLARQCGFDNINVDLISAVPKQTVESWENSVKEIINLRPEHISAYSLIIEEGTPFSKLYGEGTEGEKHLPSEEHERLMYQRTEKLLAEAGYYRYEISNYAKPGKECRHNLGYWERKNYLGLGLGASSLVENVRFKNIDHLENYMEHASDVERIQEEKEFLTETEQREEFIFLGLRKMEGISKVKFEEIFGNSLQSYYGEHIAVLKREHLLEETEEYLRLTKKGIDISNYVFAELLS